IADEPIVDEEKKKRKEKKKEEKKKLKADLESFKYLTEAEGQPKEKKKKKKKKSKSSEDHSESVPSASLQPSNEVKLAETNQSVPADTKVDESKVEETANQHNTTQDDTAVI
ncbi:hypothetical protein A2U01_0065083, partial [Trifolium medium]|nr:hypothetical protein [Trifolium medium]